MQGYQNFAPKKRAGEREKLPAGCYVARIMNAEEIVGQYGRTLLLSFDIIEGEYKDFFTKDYNANKGRPDNKWRGVLRMGVPAGDGSERDEWKRNSFEGNIWAIEDSNPDYHWDWNEKALKGKLIGVNFRNKEWEMTDSKGEHRTGWTTECARLESVEDVRNDRVKPAKDKPLKKDPVAEIARQQSANGGFTALDDTSDLPWTL